MRNLLPILLLATASTVAEEIRFSRDIRPLLSDRCFKCHGFDEEAREADLGLHTFEEATRDLGGYAAIAPAHPDRSELLARIASADPEERMPPPSANKPALSPEEVDLIRRWIEQGARYEKHWAFVPPEKPELPRGKANHPVDRFIDREIEGRGLPRNGRADPHTLIRRLSLDLRGYPPVPDEVNSFIAAYSDSPESAWREWVETFLASPSYGEKWAREWLDLARYADTNGYEKDRPRSIWPFRDWVIGALNADMPYDRFTIEQIAGDMLPSPTQSQLIATGFHRNTMLNEEGGIDPLEFRYHAMVDRVATTGTVWMGLTTGCAQCHTHKFDPITHRDYFSLMALLNNADEPEIEVRTPEIEARRKTLLGEIGALENEAVAAVPGGPFEKWITGLDKPPLVAWVPLTPVTAEAELPKLAILNDASVLASGDFTKREVYRVRFGGLPPEKITALRLEVLPHDSLPAKGPGVAYYEGRKGDFFLSEIKASSGGKKLGFNGASANYGNISIGKGAKAENVFDGDGSTGWSTAGREGEAHHLILNLAAPVRVDELDLEMLFERHFVAALGRFRLSATTREGEVRADSSGIPHPDEADEREMKLAFIEQSALPEMKAWKKKLEQKRKSLPAFPTTLVFRERPADHPRPTHLHQRGEYIRPGEEVSPAVPAVFPQLPDDAPADRLALAKWLVGDANPLGARVAVNRAWRSFFGRGLVRTEGDFGYQSIPPSHPELLDWLAVFFRESGFSMKQLHRLIVTSETYRKDSSSSPELRDRDPKNLLLARGPRFRLTGEMIRDSALRVSGLLHHEIGGPGIRPPQPPGVTALAYGATRWNPSPAPDRYRRSLYTFAKRTAPFAAYLTFDGPTGESCLPRRERSNTPLQALTLLNDEMFFEAARHLARSVDSPGAAPRDVLSGLFRRVLTRPPTPRELDRIESWFTSQRTRIASGDLPAEDLLPGGKKADPDRAALVLVARVLLNLDEAITKE